MDFPGSVFKGLTYLFAAEKLMILFSYLSFRDLDWDGRGDQI